MFVDVPMEGLNFGPVLAIYIWVIPLILREKLHDVVELDVVSQPW